MSEAPFDRDLSVARAVAQATLATEGVHSLGAGRFAEAATYGAGEKVSGVVVGDAEISVHVVATYPPTGTIPELADKVRERVRPGAANRPVNVVVEDIVSEDAVSGSEGGSG